MYPKGNLLPRVVALPLVLPAQVRRQIILHGRTGRGVGGHVAHVLPYRCKALLPFQRKCANESTNTNRYLAGWQYGIFLHNLDGFGGSTFKTSDKSGSTKKADKTCTSSSSDEGMSIFRLQVLSLVRRVVVLSFPACVESHCLVS